MKRVNVRNGFVLAFMLAITFMSAVPVAARNAVRSAPATVASTTSLMLPMNCPPPPDPNAVQVMVDLDSVYLHKASNWDSPVVGRGVKFDCFNPVGRNADL